jgi:RimJ/RimL family protein N-acetyltransferase
VLDRPVEADLAAIVTACSDPETMRWMPFPDPFTEEHARACLEPVPHPPTAGCRLHLAIREAPGGPLAGMISVRFRDTWECASGYWIHPDARGRGLASRAIAACARHAFATWGPKRLELLIRSDNLGSRRAAQRAGAVFEGIRRNGVLFADRDELFDALIYALIPEDL